MVVIDKGDARRLVGRLHTGGRGHIGEFATAMVLEQQHAIAHGHGDIRQAIVVEVADSAGHAGTAGYQAGLRAGHQGEAPAPGFSIRPDGILAGCHHQEVRLFAHGRNQASSALGAIAWFSCRSSHVVDGLLCEGDRNHRTHLRVHGQRILYQRVVALIAIGVCEGRSDLLLVQCFEALESSGRLVSPAQAL